MNRKDANRLLVSGLTGLLVISTLAKTVFADETAEPPLVYSLQIGDQTVVISDGESIQLKGSFSDPEVKLTTHPHRVFKGHGVTFKYPKAFTFEADVEDPLSKSWTFSGNDLKIIFFVIDSSVSPSEFAGNMIEQFGEENAKIVDKDAKIVFGKQQLDGTSLELTIASHRLVMDIFNIPTPGDQTRLLVFQDNLDDSGERSKEGIDCIALIKASFELKE